MEDRLLPRFDVAAAAGVEQIEDSLLSATINLAALGLEPSQIEQRQVGFWMQERLSDGQTVSVPAQAELPPDQQDGIRLTWLAPAGAGATRRVDLRISARKEAARCRFQVFKFCLTPMTASG